jgi:transposase
VDASQVATFYRFWDEFYKRRWKIERMNSWLLSHRRVAVRYERKVENYVGFVYLACIRILLRHYFWDEF